MIDRTILEVICFFPNILISATYFLLICHAQSSTEAKLQCGFECLLEILRLRRSRALVSEDATGSVRDGAWEFGEPTKNQGVPHSRTKATPTTKTFNEFYWIVTPNCIFSVTQVMSTPDFAEHWMMKFMDTPEMCSFVIKMVTSQIISPTVGSMPQSAQAYLQKPLVCG